MPARGPDMESFLGQIARLSFASGQAEGEPIESGIELLDELFKVRWFHHAASIADKRHGQAIGSRRLSLYAGVLHQPLEIATFPRRNGERQLGGVGAIWPL